jgi:dethiobiotin synthetase
MTRPERLVVVLGTGTEVGKTWVSSRLLAHLRGAGLVVSARKPAQSFDLPGTGVPEPTDADLLAAATGEAPRDVCRADRCYPLALAPPMAADRLGRPPIRLIDLAVELAWPPEVRVGLVEGAGGVRSPIAHDGDGADLARLLEPDLVVVVADAGLGTIHAVRSAVDALAGLPVVVLLNRFDDEDGLHAGNAAWLRERDGIDLVTSVTALAAHPALLGDDPGAPR